MNELTKVSEITPEDAADFLRIPELTQEDKHTLSTLISIAKNFVKGYTGQTELDNFQDFVIVVLVLVQDMWDNRSYHIDNSNLNTVVETILGMHSINLL